MTRLRRACLILAGVVIIVAGIGWFYVDARLPRAQQLAERKLWKQARRELDWYVRLHPANSTARLLMADCWAKDDDIPQLESATNALQHLNAIPRSSPVADQVEVRKGRTLFFILHQPGAAEACFRRALDLNPNLLEANALLMRLMEMTGRHHQTESLFWRAYEQSPIESRPVLLRDWYMSQFFPTTANEVLDRLMGFVHANEYPDRQTESRRYISFRENEPASVLGHASLALWLQQEGQPAIAWELIERTTQTLPKASQDAFFLSVSIAIAMDLGRFENAQQAFDKWPSPREGHDYWKWEAIVAEEIGRDFDRAIRAYDRALTTWPGSSDWRLRYRKVNCLLQMGRSQDAQSERALAEAIEKLMDHEVHSRLRKILGDLNNPDNLQEMADFYKALGRPREAACWAAAKSYVKN
jgi:tetratricopeptide (TPR) repeat protein